MCTGARYLGGNIGDDDSKLDCLREGTLAWDCHWSSMALRNWNGTASILHSREGVTQGGPLAMIVYGVGTLPLINNLKWEIPDAT